MHYYHGSNKLFDVFDINMAGSGMNLNQHLVIMRQNGKPVPLKTIHLTPHKRYAIECAQHLKSRNNKAYVYKVEVKGQEDIEYKKYMSNICITNTSMLTILKVTEII